MHGIHPLWLVVVSVVVAAVPLVVGMLTSYLRVSIVLGMLRSGFGAQQVPSGLVVMVVSLALSIIIMRPQLAATAASVETLDIKAIAEAPSIEALKALAVVTVPWRTFMQEHTSERVRTVLIQAGSDKNQSVQQSAKAEQPAADDWTILIPAFVVTELTKAFSMAFVILLPFLAIDLIVANVLVGMGMHMVSPVMIALPLKLLLFVVVDGWLLLSRGLIFSFTHV